MSIRIAFWPSYKHLASLVHKPAPSSGLHQDVVEKVTGFIRVYPGFRVTGNLAIGNPETVVFGGFR